MNKELIQQIMGDEETRCLIADTFGQLVDDAVDDELGYDDLMRGALAALSKLNDEPVVGDVITIEVSNHMWVRGEYICTEPDGRLLVSIPGKTPVYKVTNEEIYAGERVDMTVKGEKGRGKPDLVGTGVQKGMIARLKSARRG